MISSTRSQFSRIENMPRFISIDSSKIVGIAQKSSNVSQFFFKGLLSMVTEAVFYQIAQKTLLDREVKVTFCKLKLTELVALVATAILFGIASLINGVGVIPVMISALNATGIGVLQCHYGLTTAAALRWMRKAYFEVK